MKTITDKLAHNARAIVRWERKLRRAAFAIDKLRKQRVRLERKLVITPDVPDRPSALAAEVIIRENRAELNPQNSAPVEDDPLKMPTFLRRSKADQAAIDKAKAERAERAKAKAKGQAEARRARRSGATRQMPKVGKAALDFIRNGC